MNREDAHKLLGGYATGTLTEAEREALFAAALEDQELFEALMKEESLREAIADPATKDVLLRALERPPERVWWRGWRPLVGAVAMAGVVLGGIAVWRGSRERPESVMVAQAPVVKPPAVIEAQPAAPASAPAPARAPAALAKTQRAKSQKPAASAKDVTGGLAVQEEVRRAEADAAPAAVPPAPSPRALSQQQSAAVQAAPILDRAVATSSFRAGTGNAVMDKKVAVLISWTILRGNVEVPPETVLDAGETVRLRVVSQMPGELSVRGGDTVLASGQAEPGTPLDLGPIPPVTRELQFVLTREGTVPFRVRFNLHYAQ